VLRRSPLHIHVVTRGYGEQSLKEYVNQMGSTGDAHSVGVSSR
jgi:hypothetical protein